MKNILLFGALLILAAPFIFLLTCGHEDIISDGDGLGYTEDVGVDCDINCYELWCKSDDFIECRSQFCVGTEGDTYCTQPCDIDGECPIGYTCTEECDDAVAKNSLCVKDEHFELLQELEFCP